MSTRTRDWSKAIPIDHTQVKYGPTKIRDVREDLEDRLSDILAGFTTGETVNGIKLSRLLTVGTATTVNPGTGTAAAVDIIGLTSGTMTEVVIRNSSGNATLLTYQGRLQVGKLANDQYMIAVGTGSGDVNVMKVNTAGVTEFYNVVRFDTGVSFISHPLAPNTAPASDLQLAAKGYVDRIVATSTGTTTLSQILDYGTGASTGVAKIQANLIICYGSITIAGTSEQAITNLPFTSATSYMVAVSQESTAHNIGNNHGFFRDSGAQITIYNGSSSTATIGWIAIGT